MECEVCVIGLGVSSIPLLKLLQQSGTDFRVVTSTAFGIWRKLSDAGENFDLVTTIESTNYSWWDYDYDFPFYTARSYHEKLLAELTPELNDRVQYAQVSCVEEKDGKYRIFGQDGELLVSSSHLVHSVGFSPDKNILPNLGRIAEAQKDGAGKHFLVFGFSDTTNLYISRLIHAGHRVTLACRHFHVVDKIGSTHGNVGGPFDQYEPMQHWTGRSLPPNVTGVLVPLPIKGAKVGSPSWIAGKITSYVAGLVGLKQVVDLRKFDTEFQSKAGGLVTDGKTDVPGGLGYLVKQWPVDEYVRFYNDEKHQKRMLEEGIFLNDIYFFIQQGLVKLYHRDDVQHISGKKYRLGDEGDEMEFDEVFFCQEAKHNVLQMQNFCPNYCYTDHLFGIWNKKQPNMYFLGTTRPYTGAFGCIAEVNAMFVHRMITDAQFARGISDQFPAYMHRQRVTHYVQASEPDKLHVHWAGMHILRVSQVLGCELSKEGAKRHGLEKEWMTGPINALRCRIVGPYALPDAAARYRKSCEKLGTNYMYLNMIYRIWGDRLVVASWVLTLLLNAGMRWNTMNPVEQAMSAGVTYFLATKSTAMSQIRGFLLMLAFDSLYHSRAWVMLFLNVLQLLFSIVCLIQGTSFGVPLLVRLGVVTDGVFLALGYISFPRAFFGDMRARSPHKQWLFETYLKQPKTKT